MLMVQDAEKNKNRARRNCHKCLYVYKEQHLKNRIVLNKSYVTV